LHRAGCQAIYFPIAVVRFGLPLQGRYFWVRTPWALPTATMVQAVGLIVSAISAETARGFCFLGCVRLRKGKTLLCWDKGVYNMVPVIISCTASDWQNSLRNMLSQKMDVDLTNANFEFDGVYLEELAKENTMYFVKDETLKAVCFRSRKI